MRLVADEARERFGDAEVGRLATVTPDGRPHVVPVVFAVDGDAVFVAVDDKPKTTREVARLRNVEANPAVSILVDHYADDWSRLWWVRADGEATILRDEAEMERPIALLSAKYHQYRDHPPPGPVIAISVRRWVGWTGGSGLLGQSGG